MMFLLPLALMLGLNEQGVVRTNEPWEWARVAFAAVVTGLYAWYFVAESRSSGSGERESSGALFILLFMVFAFNWITATSLTPLFITRESVEAVDILEDAKRVTHYRSKGGQDLTRTCEHYVVFKRPDGHTEGMCTDLTRGNPLVVPAKGNLRLRKGLAGEVYLGISQVPVNHQGS